MGLLQLVGSALLAQTPDGLRRQIQDTENTQTIICVIGGVALLFALLGIVIRSALKEYRKSNGPVVADAGHGRFRVTGVDRQTKMDAAQHYDADSPENAKAKAELDGMVVTRVERA